MIKKQEWIDRALKAEAEVERLRNSSTTEQDILDIINALPDVRNYSAKDRYHDFRQVFNTDQGKRVLAELIAWGRLGQPKIYSSPIDPYMTHVREGEVNFVRRILAVYRFEPKDQPNQATRMKDE